MLKYTTDGCLPLGMTILDWHGLAEVSWADVEDEIIFPHYDVAGGSWTGSYILAFWQVKKKIIVINCDWALKCEIVWWLTYGGTSPFNVSQKFKKKKLPMKNYERTIFVLQSRKKFYTTRVKILILVHDIQTNNWRQKLAWMYKNLQNYSWQALLIKRKLILRKTTSKFKTKNLWLLD